MYRSIILILVACTCILLNCAQAFGDSWDSVVFREDCDADGMPDPSKWVINHPPNWWWVMGRTHFPNPDPWLPTSEFPVVTSGVCRIKHHLYNPYDGGNPNTTFLGGEIHTFMEFEPNRSYRFEARVRFNPGDPPYVPCPNGVVASFFLYGYDGSKSDEIDFEFLTNQMNDDENYPNGDPVFLNTWDESLQKPQCLCLDCIPPAGLDLTEWNTFRIYWYPDEPCVEWWWLDPVNGWTLLRVETDPAFVPDESMALYFNFWASTAAWPCAYDAGLQPVNDPGENQKCAYEIDYVEVRASSVVPALSARGVILFFILLVMGASVGVIRRRVIKRRMKGVLTPV